MGKITVIFVIAGSLMLTGCATNGGASNRQAMGGVFGCLGGALIGALASKNKALGAAAGCAAGAAAGITIGSLLDAKEKQQLAEARLRAAESGQRVDWGHSEAEQVADNTPKKHKRQHHHTKKHESAPAQTQIASTDNNDNDVHAANGWVIPVKTYVASNGQTCRDLKEHAVKNGKSADNDVTMCKSDNGWVVPQSA